MGSLSDRNNPSKKTSSPKKPPKKPNTSTPPKKSKKTSGEVTNLRKQLRQAEHIITLTESLLWQLIPVYDEDGEIVTGWKKFDPRGQHGDQKGKLMEKILEEIKDFRTQ